MDKYHFDENKNRMFINNDDLYSDLNIIKNINGTAHYFFNGFAYKKETKEIVIDLIRANSQFSEYQNVMCKGKYRKMKFSDKYEFINFNDIKNDGIKNSIVVAIQERNPDEAMEMFTWVDSTNGGYWEAEDRDLLQNYEEDIVDDFLEEMVLQHRINSKLRDSMVVVLVKKSRLNNKIRVTEDNLILI